GGNAVDFFLRARFVGRFGGVCALGVIAVDQYRDRQALDAARLDHFGAGGAGNLVIYDFLALAIGVAIAGLLGACTLIGAGKLVADGYGVVRCGLVGLRGFLAALGRAYDAAFRIVAIRCLLNARVIEFGGDGHAGAARADDRSD